jgi:hypothetical protein
MGGLILDNILVFLFRVILRLARELRAAKWVTTEAVVSQALADTGMYPSTAVKYSYIVAGTKYHGEFSRGFWHADSAEGFAEWFQESRTIVIRYDPANHERSYFLETDQRRLQSPQEAANRS